MKVGFIGLGHMGGPMAVNLTKTDHELYVFDVVPEAVKHLVKLGAKELTDAVVPELDVLMTMVQTGDQVSSIVSGDDGYFAKLKSNSIFIDCSSIEIASSRQLHKEAKAADIAMLDAPVSGGVAGAEAGSLTFMVGGDEKTFQRALPLLERMGKKIIHAGAPGNGGAAKICNNLLLGISMVGVCEAFTLAKKLGLDPKTFFDISSNASGQCWSMTSYCPVPGIVESAPSNRDYEPGFTAAMMLKDLRLGQHAAESVSASIPLGATAAELYELFNNEGHAQLDFSGIIKFIAGIEG